MQISLGSFRRCLWALCALLAAFKLEAHSASEEMTDAAVNLLATLTPEQRAKVSFDFGSDERLNWHFVPRPRKGLPFKEMTAAQQRLAHALLASGLSQRGYAKALTIMSLEQILREIEAGKTGVVRDEELYFVSIFGAPGDSKAWAWRVEGHHLALNFSIVNGSLIASSPSFFGTNPGDVLEGPRKGLRVLGEEEDLGRALVQSLTDEQRKSALIATNSPKEIITSNDRKAKRLDQAGIGFAQLSKDQKAQLHKLIEEYAHRYRPELAAADLAKIEKGGWNQVRFSWAGSSKKYEAHYYRIQGPSFLLEYANVQNNANHVHTVWRDFDGDFGEDLLKRHYEQSHR
ncbi:MAG: DUF3500 domain-containing protein [Verrucomicrobia bacterium]|nr:DUF3500 domain-containing protein [Verrucomicrobiota bacterium]